MHQHTGFEEYDEGFITMKDIKFLGILFLGFIGWVIVIGEIMGKNELGGWPWIAQRIAFWTFISFVFTTAAYLNNIWFIDG